MSSKKSFKRPKRRMSKRSRKGPTTKSLAKKVRKIENNLIELKWIDIALAATPIPNGSGVTTNSWSFPVQGDTAFTRNGNVINPTSFLMKLTLNTDPDLIEPCRVRVLVFWDRQCNGAVPTIQGINANGLLDDTVITDTTKSYRNLNTIERYTILSDKLYTFNPVLQLTTTLAGAVTTTTTVVALERTISARYKLSRKIKLDANAGAITDVVTNSLNVTIISDQAANQPEVIGSFRMYYRDA